MIAPVRRIRSLKNPTQKMSKSDPNPASRLLITDSAQEIWKKTMAAVTDSIGSITYDPAQRPGVSNLLEILSVFDSDCRTPELLAQTFAGASLKDLKAAVATSVARGLADISERYRELLADKSTYLQSVQEEGASQARSRAAETMLSVRSAMGL
jgi:tryptophanyl-tRNA synthetase